MFVKPLARGSVSPTAFAVSLSGADVQTQASGESISVEAPGDRGTPSAKAGTEASPLDSEVPASMKDKGKKPQHFFGISQRTTMFAATIALLSIAFFAVAIIAHEKKMLRNHLVSRARLLAASLDHTTGQLIMTNEFGKVAQQCSTMVEKNPEAVYCVVTRKSDGSSVITYKDDSKNGIEVRNETMAGAMWLPEGEFVEHERFNNPEDAEFANRYVLHYSYPFFNHAGSDWGWIHVGLDLREYRESLAETYQIIALLAFSSLLVGVVFAVRFARGLTKPIFQLKRWAEWVAQGNFSGRVEIDRDDEIGDLADSMNRMTSDLYVGMKREAELREKDVLLKEIHHRVKNNMQILSSLLRMQGRSSEIPGMTDALLESESRIRSMGLIHEKLYQSDSLSNIQFANYVEALARELQRMYVGTAGRIEVKVDAPDDIAFALDTALPCGLIVNELVSNSLKYAFPDNGEGCISISISRVVNQPHSYAMVVADDGAGLKAHGDGPKGVREGSLGTRLVDMLADQLDGEAEQYEPDEGGVATRITFRESIYEERL